MRSIRFELDLESVGAGSFEWFYLREMTFHFDFVENFMFEPLSVLFIILLISNWLWCFMKSYGRAMELETSRAFAMIETGNIFLMLGSYRKVCICLCTSLSQFHIKFCICLVSNFIDFSVFSICEIGVIKEKLIKF